LNLLDKEGNQREEILDMFMFEKSVKNFEFLKSLDLKPKNRDSERLYLIQKIHEILIDRKIYYLIIFDDSTISIFDSRTFNIINEFRTKYEYDINAHSEFSAKQSKAE